MSKRRQRESEIEKNAAQIQRIKVDPSLDVPMYLHPDYWEGLDQGRLPI